ncbi:small ribosomal subunit protein mS37-like [Antedon mediterranea]|uniref:small ribosomal subunit protein mS37-like n=1 Tax=Antedon mediterranea TaxID=105859 RepID=UPI003AF52363
MSKRFNEIIIRNVYKPDPKIPLQKPFALRNNVSLRKNKKEAASCLTEMSILLACWKKSSYNDADCLKEISAFQKCFNESEKEKRAFAAAAREGKIEAGRTTSEQLNRLMKKFPQRNR